LIWRVAFGLAGLVGLVESVLYLTTGGLRTRASTVLRSLTITLCALIVLVSIAPQLPAALGIGLLPSEVEAILASLLLIVGAHMAYFALTESAETAGA
jgi:hypothetical protein